MYFALAMGALVATVAPLGERFFARRAPKIVERADVALAAFVVALTTLAFVARDGVRAYFYARATGGRFNEGGRRIESDGDKIAVLRWLVEQPFAPPARGTIRLHPSMHPNWSQTWALGGRTVVTGADPAAEGDATIVVADVRFVPDSTKQQWFDDFAVTAVGPVWIVRRDAERRATAMSIVESEPSPFERYFVSGTEPHRTIAPGPYATWELVAHYADAPPPPPDAAPSTRDDHRVRYDIAALAGDARTMRDERDAITRGCTALDASFSDGTRIFAACFDDGAAPKLTLLFESGGPLGPDTELSVVSSVVDGPRFSTTMTDPTVRQSSFPFVLPPSRFKKGFVYAHSLWIRARPGVEVFTARFVGKDAPTIAAPVEVLRL
jgi:hypothetical protein